MRKAIVFALTMLSILTLAATPASAKFSYNVDVYVNGEHVHFPDQRAFIDTKTNRTYVPIRFVAESLGARVDWDAQKMTAVINRGGKTVTVTVGTNIARVDNKLVTLDAAALLVNQRTVVPLRFVSEALGEKVKWEPGLRGKVLIGEGALSGKPVDVVLGRYTVQNGYKIPVEHNFWTKSSTGFVGDGITKAELSLVATVMSPTIDQEYRMMYAILESKFSKQDVALMLDRFRHKVATRDPMASVPSERLVLGGKNIAVGSPANNSLLNVKVWGDAR